jgi:hypothetical protein
MSDAGALSRSEESDENSASNQIAGRPARPARVFDRGTGPSDADVTGTGVCDVVAAIVSVDTRRMLLALSARRRLFAAACRERPARAWAVPFPALLFTAVLCASPRSARAEPDALLDWTSPPACPDARAVMNSLSELMDVTSARWERFRSIRGRLAALSTGGFELELVFEGPSSTSARRFRVRDCGDSADLAAAALALALDPRSQGLGLDGASEPRLAAPLEAASDGEPAGAGEAQASEGQPRDTVAREDDASNDAAAERSVPLEVDVGLGGVLDPNGLGAVGFGGSVWATARRDRLSLSLHADWLPQASLDLGARSVNVGLAAAGVRLCYAPGAALAVCPELEAGSLRASGAELDNGRSARDPWLAPGASVELRAPLFAAASLVSRVAVLLPLVRGEYLVNGGELLHRTPPVVLRLSLGVELPVR